MSFIDRLFPRSGSNGAAPADPETTVVPVTAAPPAQPAGSANAPQGARTDTQPPPTVAELETRRLGLAQELADRQWDLGGLTYEMAVRDHFRLDVLVAHAARLQEIDAELAEIERLLRLDEAGAAGECAACGAPHSRGAVYCWSCGVQLIPVETAGT